MTPGRASRVFRLYLDHVTRHAWWVLAVSILLTTIVGAGLVRLRIYVDLDANLPAGHPYVETDREIRAQFGGRYVMALGIEPREGTIWTPRILALLVDLTRDAIALPDILEPNVMSLAAPKAKDIRGTAEGFEVQQILEIAPTDEEGVAAVRAAYERNRRSLGPIVGTDQRAALVSLDFLESAGDEAVYRQTRELMAKYEAAYPDVRFTLTGSSSFNHFFSENARRTLRFFGLALAVIMATLYAAFRSGQGMILPIVTGLLSTVWGLGLMGYAGTHMDGWNSMTPILILAVAAGHSVQILKRYYEEYARLATIADPSERSRLAVVEATHRIGLVMIVAGVVAAGSFASLAVFGIATIRAFGIFTALGILSAVVLEMTFVPAFRTLMRPPRAAERPRVSRSDRWLRQLGASLAEPRVRVAVCAAALLLVGVSVFASRWIVTNSTARFYLGETNEARVGWEFMNDHFGGMVSFDVLVEGAEENALQDPAVLQWMDRLTETLRALPGTGFAISLADVVRRLHLAMHEDEPAYDAIPDNRRLVAQYLFLYGMSSDPEDFSRFQSSDGRRGLLRAGLRSDEDRDVLVAVRAVEKFAAENPLPEGVTWRVSGMAAIALAMNQTLTEGKIWNMAQILAMIYLISSLILRSPAAGFFVLIPLVLAISATFAVLGLFGIWLNMGTATVAAMGVGIGADYAIYVLYRFREELRRTGTVTAATAETIATSGKAVLFVAAAISGGYASLAVSDFYVNDILSMLVPITMVVSSLASITVMPAALLHFRPRFLGFHTSPEKLDPASARVAAG